MEQTQQKERNQYSDQELLENIARQDKNAFAILYDRHSAKLFGLAIQILKDRPLAEDVLQDIYLSLWKNAGAFDPQKGKPVTWLLVLCRNRCIDKLRQKERRQRRTTDLDETTLQSIEMNESESPLEFVHQKEVQKVVTRALEGLPEEQRVPIEMAYFKGMSQSEIAKDLNLPLGTVKTRTRLGMQKLKDSIADPAK